MTLELMDYKGERKSFTIGNLDEIAVINVEVISGDEVATVVYKDYRIETLDTSYRVQNHPDGVYELYDFRKELNLLTNERWINRKSTTWFYDEEL